MDAYPATQNYIPQEKLSPPGIVRRLSAEELKPKSPLEIMLAQASPRTSPESVDQGIKETSQQNTREYFRRLGWEVYDDSGLNSRFNKTYQSRVVADKFAQGLEGMRGMFSDIEYSTVQGLLNQQSSDKITSVYVTTDNYIALRVVSQDKNIGLDGVYILLKPLSREGADKVRKLAK